MKRCLILFATLAACARPPVQYSGGVTVVSPQLLRLSPDVQVVADADKPMFHAAGSYWLFHDGGWYRGTSMSGPWLLDREPAWQIRQVDQPYAYTHYRLNRPSTKTETVTQTATNERATPSEEPARSNKKPEQRNKMFDF